MIWIRTGCDRLGWTTDASYYLNEKAVGRAIEKSGINGSLIQLGGAFGASLAAVVINLSGIHSIVFVTLLTSLALILIQVVSMRKYP